MAKVRDLTKSAERFQRRAAGAVQEYQDGVAENTTWEGNTAGAEANYAAGVQKAVSKKSFGKGVKRSGQRAFQDGVAKKGSTRYPQGVSDAGPQWQSGFDPFAKTIEATQLPARGPKGSEGNYDRVRKIGQALHDKKESMKG